MRKENDYIAEYITTNYPKLLGVDYAVWKFKNKMADFLVDVIDTINCALKIQEEKEEPKEEPKDKWNKLYD